MSFVTESLSDSERRSSFRVAGSWCDVTSHQLGSGVLLNVTRCQYEPAFSFDVVQPAAELELVVSKGGTLLVNGPDGSGQQRGGNALQLGRTARPTPLCVRPADETVTECVSVSLGAERLRELLGAEVLPRAFRVVTEDERAQPLISRALTPRLWDLLEEIAGAQVKGAGRRVWHAAKSLELIAVMTDELVEGAEASDGPLSTLDVERLWRVRKCLDARLERAPTLSELARLAGFSETKLKGAFRALFGASVFGYLRQARLMEARRLLLLRGFNVTEVAQRVGYANPSKFAAAFRREFGRRPSEL